jgi:hypothetical protein
MRIQAQAIQQQNVFQRQQDVLQERFAQAEHLFQQHQNLEFSLIRARADAARQLAADIYSDKETDPLTMYTKANAAMLKYMENLNKDQNTLASLMVERAKLYPDGDAAGAAKKDPEGYQALNTGIALRQQQIKINQGMIGNLQTQIANIKSAMNIDNGGVDSGGSSSNSNSTDGDSLPDFTDPSNYLNSDQE